MDSLSPVLAIIPARKGSRGLPRKNLLQLCGRPILSYTLEAIRESTLIDHVTVLTDDPEFAALADGLGLAVIEEPAHLAQDNSPVEPAIAFAIQQVERLQDCHPGTVVICEPNVPIRPWGIFDQTIQALWESDSEAAYTLELANIHHPAWSVALQDRRIQFPGKQPETYRQALPPRYHLTAAAYVYRRERDWTATYIHGAIGVVHEEGACLHIDTRIDAEFAEFLLHKKILDAADDTGVRSPTLLADVRT